MKAIAFIISKSCWAANFIESRKYINLFNTLHSFYDMVDNLSKLSEIIKNKETVGSKVQVKISNQSHPSTEQ